MELSPWMIKAQSFELHPVTLTNDAKAVIALTTRLGSSQRPSLSAKRWHRLVGALEDSGHKPADIFDRQFDLSGIPGVDAQTSDAVMKLLQDSTAAMLEADDLGRKGIWCLTIVDDDYPSALRDRLGTDAPPVLFGAGDMNLLTTPGLGVVGSRGVGDKGAEVAKDLARQAVTLDLTVVSGGARGVDQLAMKAAMGSGGRVIGVLADSLLARIRKPDVLEALDEGRVALVSQWAPASGFSPAAAMARNKLIYALSPVTVVVCSDLSGGTWTGATEALGAGNGVVAVWRGEGEGPGSAELERRGAVRLSSAGDLADLLGQSPGRRPEQMSLIEPT